MALVRRRASSAADLKALAHPVRLALVELLRERGPLTATQAGGLLGQTPANVSWHLRTLAAGGFVRSLPPGPGRQRPWKAVLEGYDIAALAQTPGVDASIEEDARQLSRIERIEPGSVVRTQVTVALTDEEAHALAAEIRELIADRRSTSLIDHATAPRRERRVLVWITPAGDSETS